MNHILKEAYCYAPKEIRPLRKCVFWQYKPLMSLWKACSAGFERAI